MVSQNSRAPRNRTMTLTGEEQEYFRSRLIKLDSEAPVEAILNRTIHQDLFKALAYLPPTFVDLLFVDPPYNIKKSFNHRSFSPMPLADYEAWLESWLVSNVS